MISIAKQQWAVEEASEALDRCRAGEGEATVVKGRNGQLPCSNKIDIEGFFNL